MRGISFLSVLDKTEANVIEDIANSGRFSVIFKPLKEHLDVLSDRKTDHFDNAFVLDATDLEYYFKVLVRCELKNFISSWILVVYDKDTKGIVKVKQIS